MRIMGKMIPQGMAVPNVRAARKNMRRLYVRRARGLKSMTYGPVKRLLRTRSRVLSVRDASSLYCVYIYVCLYVCVYVCVLCCVYCVHYIHS